MVLSLMGRACVSRAREEKAPVPKVLREMYEAKLAWQFPDKPCEVRLFLEGEQDDLFVHELTFWQKAHVETVA